MMVRPGNTIYAMYMRKLRDVRALGGVGRQSGLYLRHRKPRGSQVTTLLCLLLCLLVSTLCFIAQSAVLFRHSPAHLSFFASLLWPPFADILALVGGALFVCGAVDGTVVCLFVVASNCNTAVGLFSRILAMDSFRSIGFIYVLVEYAIAFSAKIMICRLVNLMIAHADASPALLEPSGDDADHEWVREHVLFRRTSASSTEPGVDANGAPLARGISEDLHTILLASMTPTQASGNRGLPRQVSGGSFCDDWTS